MHKRIIIIGAGGAALSAAIEAAKHNVEIYIIAKGHYAKNNYRWASNGGCTWKTHGFNAAINEGDSIDSHIQDTIKGGSFANNPKLVKMLCNGAYHLIDWLKDLGINFDNSHGKIQTRPFGGCEIPRSVHIEDRLGFYIQNAFNKKVSQLIDSGKVHILENTRATKLLKNDNNDVVGVRTLHVDTLEIMDIFCNAVIIADGGGTSMYAPSAASCDKTCDGIVMALEAGIDIIDMEFVQFHPTGIASKIPVFDGSLVEEVLRFDGAKLLNKLNERFMFNYNKLGEIATRDEVARGIYTEICYGNGFENDAVKLDISNCKHLVAKSYPALNERLRQAGYDIDSSSFIFVRPTAHFLMGGIKIDEFAATNISGVYACGESTGGVHGANRLGGNGLSEALVFGRIAGENAAHYSLQCKAPIEKIQFNESFKIEIKDPIYSTDSFLNLLRRSMYWNVGPVRALDKLKKMQLIIFDIKSKINQIDICTGSRGAYQVQQYFDLQNLLQASDMIVTASLLREESRGAHYREDCKIMSQKFVGLKFRYENGNLINSGYSIIS